MRILQIHNFYQQPGGEDIVLANEEKLLMRHGHEVVQYVMHNDSINGMTKLQVAAKTIWNSDSHKAVRQKIEKHGIDLVHAHNTFPLISPAIYYAARGAKVPVVQTLHNYRLLCPAATFFRDGRLCEDCMGKPFAWPALLHSCYRDSFAASGMTALMQATHRTARTYSSKVNAYVALSKFSMEKFVEGGLPRQLITVKPNFVMDDPGIGSGQGTGNGKKYVLFAGRLAREKGLHTLLKAWSQFTQPISLKIAGDGPLRGEVEALAQSLPNVEYLGYCARPRVYELMRNAALLVFPSEWYEASPLSVMEAMACGTPVLAADHGSLTEMIVPGKSGMLFPAGDAEGLVRSLESLFGSEDQLCDMRYSTRQYYESHFAPGPNYDALMAIYSSVLPKGAD
jgi:glycosyltransferase involved in cell wall biosynthesis